MRKKISNKKLQLVMSEINKRLKTDAIKFASDEKEKEKIPSGIKEIDTLIGGGFVRGNYSVIYGSPASGKTTLMLNTIANSQKEDKICCLLDLEHSWDKMWAEKQGVDISKLVLVEDVNTAEEAMDIVRKLATEKVVDLICVDSIHGFSPHDEQYGKGNIEKSLEKDEMALLARKMGKFLRVVGTPIYKGKIAIILIGQVRTEGIGSFFTREGLSGGKAVHHWANLILYMHRGMKNDAPMGAIKEEYEEDGVIKTEEGEGVVGFDMIVELQKVKIFGSKSEGSKIHLPFLFEKGLIVNEKIKDVV